MNEDDISEINILPDGRIYVFGLTEKLRTLLETFQREAELHAAARGTEGIDVQLQEQPLSVAHTRD
jgi:hypothetical protein